jgi:hypothetical protein
MKTYVKKETLRVIAAIRLITPNPCTYTEWKSCFSGFHCESHKLLSAALIICKNNFLKRNPRSTIDQESPISATVVPGKFKTALTTNRSSMPLPALHQ